MKRNQMAFTLVELIVVIAIVALLATISIPNYFKYLAKAKQTEVAINLASLHAAEQLYFAEHGEYSPVLQGENGIDWQPGGYKNDKDKNFYYTYGFHASGAQEGTNYFQGKLNSPSRHLIKTHAGKNGFLAAAACDLRGKAKLDIWTIDENRNIKHVQDGLK